MGSKTIHGPTDQKKVSQHPGRFWMLTFSIVPLTLILMWNQGYWFSYEISFLSICESLKTESVCVFGVDFIRNYSWNPRWTPTWIGLGHRHGVDELNANAGPPRLLGLYLKKWCSHHLCPTLMRWLDVWCMTLVKAATAGAPEVYVRGSLN